MPQRIINIKNPGPEIDRPELGWDEGVVVFDGVRYQTHVNPGCKHVVPDGLAVRENVKVDNSASGITSPDDTAAES